jgi:hypothetical protein
MRSWFDIIKPFLKEISLQKQSLLKADMKCPIEKAKDNPVDKEIALVDNWGWQGHPNPKFLSSYQEKDRCVQSEICQAVSMFSDLRNQSTWQYIEYVVPSLRSDENPVPNVTSCHNAKVCKHGTVSYFVGYGVKNECHIVDPAFLENCIAAIRKYSFCQNSSRRWR